MLGKHTMITKVVRDIESGLILSRRLRWTDQDFARAMGVRMFTCFSTTFIGPFPANANETIVLATPPIQLAVDNAAIIILWFACIGASASTTSLAYRLRRGVLVTSPLVGANPWFDTVSVSTFQNSSGVYVDTPGVVAGQQYVLTVVQTGAAAASSWQDGCLLAVVL